MKEELCFVISSLRSVGNILARETSGNYNHIINVEAS